MCNTMLWKILVAHEQHKEMELTTNQQQIQHITKRYMWGLWYKKQVSRVWFRNYIQQDTVPLYSSTCFQLKLPSQMHRIFGDWFAAKKQPQPMKPPCDKNETAIFICRSIGNRSAINCRPVGDRLTTGRRGSSIIIGDQSSTGWRLVDDNSRLVGDGLRLVGD